ncbi:hypothetical protein GCM10009599_05600 [Luteococcus peritonei]
MGVVVWLALSVLAWRNVVLPDEPLAFGPFTMVDFRDSVWIPLDDFVHGGIPWDRPGFTARHRGVQFFPLYVPTYWYATVWLLLLPYRVAAVLWTGILVASLVWLWHTSLSLFLGRAYRRRPWLVAALTLASLALRPVQTALSQGNWALLCGAGAVAALLPALRREPEGRTRWSAVLGLLLALVKPPVGLPLLVALVLLRRRREAAWGLGLSVLLSVPVCLVVWHRAGSFGSAWRMLVRTVSDGDGATAGDPHFTRMDVLATLARVPALDQALPLALGALTVVLLTLGVAALLWRRHGSTALVLSGLALGIVLPTPNLHYALVVVLPLLVALPSLSVTRWSIDRTAALACLAAWLLVGLACLSPVRGGLRIGISPQQANLAYAVSLLLAAGLVALVALWDLQRAGLTVAVPPALETGPRTAREPTPAHAG